MFNRSLVRRGALWAFILAGLVVASPLLTESVVAPGGHCGQTNTFSGDPYTAGNVMTISWKNTCTLQKNIYLRWPDAAVVRTWAARAGGSGTITYSIPPFAPTGTWTVSGDVGGIDYATVNPIVVPKTGRLQTLGHDELVLETMRYANSGSVGTYRIMDVVDGSYWRDWTSLGETSAKMDMGDVDGDGGDELVTIPFPADTTPQVTVTSIAPDTGSKLQTLRWTFLSGKTAHDIALGDFNGDGRDEIAILYYSTSAGPNSDKYVGIWTASGQQLGTDPYSMHFLPADHIQRIAAGDLDGDGHAELFWSVDKRVENAPVDGYNWGYRNFATNFNIFRGMLNDPNHALIVGVTRFHERPNGPDKFLLMDMWGVAKLFVLDVAGSSGVVNNLIDDPDHPDWFSTNGNQGGVSSVTSGDTNGDGVDTIATLLAWSGMVYTYDLATNHVEAWGPVTTCDDSSTCASDFAFGDADNAGTFIYPTGDWKQVADDAVIVARVGAPPYAKTATTTAVGQYGFGVGAGQAQETTETVEAGFGFTVSGSAGVLRGDLTVITGISHTETKIDEVTRTDWTTQTSDQNDDTLLIAVTSYNVYKYVAWNKDVNGDGLINGNDVLWLDEPRPMMLTGTTVHQWNTGGSPLWSSYKSWTSLPEGSAWNTAGDPTTYPRDQMPTYGGAPVLWYPKDIGGSPEWNTVDVASPDKTYGFEHSVGHSVGNEFFINVDGSIRFGTDLLNVGPAFSAGYRYEKLGRETVTDYFTIGIVAPDLASNCVLWPTQPGCYAYPYKFDWIPYFYREERTSAASPNVKQSYLVLRYDVRNLASGYFPPPLYASASGSPSSGSAPLTVNFQSAVSGGTPPYAYRWNFGDGGSSTSQNPSHVYGSTGTYQATVTVTDSGIPVPQTYTSYPVTTVVGSAGSYALTIGVNGLGATDPAAGTYYYAAGTQVTATATDTDICFFFYRWILDGVSQTVGLNPITVTMNQAHTLTAYFRYDRSCKYQGPVPTGGFGGDWQVISSATDKTGTAVLSAWTARDMGSLPTYSSSTQTLGKNSGVPIASFWRG